MSRTVSYLVLCTLILLASQAAAQTRQGDVEVVHAWMHPPTLLGGASAAFFRLINNGQRVDRLVAVSSPDAHRAEIHAHVLEAGHYRMQRLRGVEVHPGAPVMFRPGGLHIMLIDIKGPLDKTKPVRLRLRFERSGEMALDVPIVRKSRWGPPITKPGPKTPTVPRVQGHRR